MNNSYCIDASPASLVACYNVETGSIRRLPEPLETNLTISALEPNGIKFVEIPNKIQKNSNDAAYSNWFSLREGVIICHENDKRRDTHPPDLWPSEIIWQSWAMTVEKENVELSSLRSIIRDSLVNINTRMIIWQAAREDAIFPVGENGSRQYLPLDPGFFALLGSVNGCSTMRMLLDHKVQTGFKTVERIVVFPCVEAADVDDFGKSRSFIIVLSDQRRQIATKSMD